MIVEEYAKNIKVGDIMYYEKYPCRVKVSRRVRREVCCWCTRYTPVRHYSDDDMMELEFEGPGPARGHAFRVVGIHTPVNETFLVERDEDY